MSDMVDKWGQEVAERGFAQVPNYLLLINQFLDDGSRLSPVESLILIQLIGSWWKKDDLPYPSMSTLARRIGVSSRQIQRAVNRLEELGLIKRTKRRHSGIISSNAYDLMPLSGVLQEVAKAFPNEYPRNVRAAPAKKLERRKRAINLEAVPEE